MREEEQSKETEIAKALEKIQERESYKERKEKQLEREI